MHLLWDAQRQAGTGYALIVHMYTLFTLRLIAQLPQYHEDYLHYTDVTSELDYMWTGVINMETAFLIEDAMTGCKYIVLFNWRRHAEPK